jgi:translation initiation factor IF-2
LLQRPRQQAGARELAERDKVEIRYYSIIYDLIDDVKALSGMLHRNARNLPGLRADPRSVQHHQGRQGRGLPVTEGKVKRGAACACCATTS